MFLDCAGTDEGRNVANNLDALMARAKSIRQDILKMTTEAGSGHPSSSLSAVEIVTALYFGGFCGMTPKIPTGRTATGSFFPRDMRHRCSTPRLPKPAIFRTKRS